MSRFENFDESAAQPKAKRPDNRDRFSQAAVIIDYNRQIFGDVKVLLVEENGDRVVSPSWKADEDYFGCINAGEWLEMSKRYRTDDEKGGSRG